MGGSGLSLTQERALAICPKVSAIISIPCSFLIICEVIHQHRLGKTTTTSNGTTAVQRALLVMSCIDILASLAWFMSTWAVPTESGFIYASGNQKTCNFQGFLLQLAIGAPLYNCSLALFYLLMIKFRWTEDQIKVVERYVNIFILTFTIGTSILLLPLNQYNHIGAVCWVIGDPVDCGNSSFQENPNEVCERGDYAWVYGLALFYAPLWICVIACVSSMIILYQEVRKVHQKSLRHSMRIIPGETARSSRGSVIGSSLQHRSSQDTKKVAIQAMLYSLSFLITWMPSSKFLKCIWGFGCVFLSARSISHLILFCFSSKKIALWSVAHWFQWSHFGLDLAAAIAEPLQGTNVMIILYSFIECNA